MPNPIRRRRFLTAGTFVPPQMAALQLWLRADRGVFSDSAFTTPITVDGTALGGWTDYSPAKNSGTQPTAGNRPVWHQQGINGMPEVQFTAASSQYLITNSPAAAFSGTNMPGTVIAVLKLVTTATGIFLGMGNSGSANPRWFSIIPQRTGLPCGSQTRERAST